MYEHGILEKHAQPAKAQTCQRDFTLIRKLCMRDAQLAPISDDEIYSHRWVVLLRTLY